MCDQCARNMAIHFCSGPVLMTIDRMTLPFKTARQNQGPGLLNGQRTTNCEVFVSHAALERIT